MYRNNQFYCVHPDWQQQYASEYNADILENKILQISKDLGEGHIFYAQAIPGMAILYIDCKINQPLQVRRLEENTYRYIFHYDLSDGTNFLIINNKKNKVGIKVNKEISVFNNQIESYFEPAVGKRTFVLRLFVDQKLMGEFLESIPGNDNYDELKIKLAGAKNGMFSESIDANSLLLFLSIKERSMFEESFHPFIKGVSLQLLSLFFKKITNPNLAESSHAITQRDGLINAKNYLLNNLTEKFPSISFLAEISGMSPTKFKILFKKEFNDTCKNLFIQEKMNLAKTMLTSGENNNLTEITFELNFSKINQFSSLYFEKFNKKPIEDFVKKRKEDAE
ncbi:AraC-type DNA-binding protein [Flavobacterium resistens]|uniref:AraC-type DNA-binding protein n=1 Tax=Flavobacterium resistens TaxID=443612 RepID=A0A521EZ47_9FLAO|nr:AraC family transcriptional regulator [Flavobacterium resistens]MRX69322.1 helix-turn-helix domain-containing protein [Flavobacterium resistens]SMO89228.1 AraC-type DNA-binding protein [Flavobacterium resistens]